MMAIGRQQDLNLASLLKGFARVEDRDDRVVAGVCIDSRKVKAGDCFIALNGTHHQGSSFVADAIDSGAVAVLMDDNDRSVDCSRPVIRVPDLASKVGPIASRFYGEPSKDIDIIAVTGTNGKTTVASLCAHAITTCRGRAAYSGTLGIGLVPNLRSTVNTTPDAVTLQSFFADAHASECHAAVVEASSHGLSQARLCGTAIDVAVFTNLGHDHLDYHSDLKAYADAKKSLFREFAPRYAIVNFDDETGREIASEVRDESQCWTYSAESNGRDIADLALIDMRVTSMGTEVSMKTPQGPVEFTTLLIGKFNVQNLLAALGALLACGIGVVEAANALAAVRGVPGRMEWVANADDGPSIVVDYAHTPESLALAISALRGITTGKVICVFGCGGDRDTAKRAEMGRAAEAGADLVFVTSDNPRSESNVSIAEHILNGMDAPHNARVIHDRREAIQAAISESGSDDSVLIAGKGHEAFQEIGGVRYPFSDQDIARAEFARLTS